MSLNFLFEHYLFIIIHVFSFLQYLGEAKQLPLASKNTCSDLFFPISHDLSLICTRHLRHRRTARHVREQSTRIYINLIWFLALYISNNRCDASGDSQSPLRIFCRLFLCAACVFPKIIRTDNTKSFRSLRKLLRGLNANPSALRLLSPGTLSS